MLELPHGRNAAMIRPSGRAGVLGRNRRRAAPEADEAASYEILDLALSGNQGSILEYAFRDSASSSTLQRSFEVVVATNNWDDARALLACLKGWILQAIKSKHANYVVQKVLEVMPTELIGFIAEEMAGQAVEIAKDRFGCRVIVRFVRHHGSSWDARVTSMLSEVQSELAHLGRTEYGVHVVKEFLDSRNPQHRQAVGRSIRGSAFQEARHRCACCIVEKALVQCATAEVHSIAEELLSNQEHIVELAKRENSARVVKAMLHISDAIAARVSRCLLASAAQIQAQDTRFGRQLLQAAQGVTNGGAAVNVASRRR